VIFEREVLMRRTIAVVGVVLAMVVSAAPRAAAFPFPTTDSCSASTSVTTVYPDRPVTITLSITPDPSAGLLIISYNDVPLYTAGVELTSFSTTLTAPELRVKLYDDTQLGEHDIPSGTVVTYRYYPFLGTADSPPLCAWSVTLSDDSTPTGATDPVAESESDSDSGSESGSGDAIEVAAVPTFTG
jgi:hypothetical protein